MRDIGKNIKELRCARRLTQEELGERLHVTRQTISNYENGRTRPDIDMLLDIAAALDTDANALLYGTPQMEDRRREYRKFAVALALFLTVYASYLFLQPISIDLMSRKYINSLNVLLASVAKPLYMLIMGWLIMQGAGLLGARPLRWSRGKYLRWGILTLIIFVAVYLFPIMVYHIVGLIWYIKGIRGGVSFPDIPVYTALADRIWWVIAFKPYLYAFLGAALWLLGFPQKKKAVVEEGREKSIENIQADADSLPR